MVSKVRRRARARSRVGAALLAAAFLTASTPAIAQAPTVAPTAAPDLTARWQSSWYFTEAFSLIQGSFTVDGTGEQQTVAVHLDGARFLALPTGCYGSSTVNIRSTISAGVDTLDCWLAPNDSAQTIAFSALVVAPAGKNVRGTVQVKGGGPSYELPARVATSGRAPAGRSVRLLSSPDFLNADVGDLAKGPNFWNPKGGTENSTNADYQRALEHGAGRLGVDVTRGRAGRR